VAGPLPIPTLPFRIDGVGPWIRRPAPVFGQHTDEVLTELLGLDTAELAALRDAGVVADRPAGL
jgi:crotonobetainyl-CoA:carnitine CoA-transferase CaiB-like acyl-CoA transferase